MDKYINVLVTAGGGIGGQAILESLAKSDQVRIIIANSAREAPLRYRADRFLLVPWANQPDSYREALNKIIEQEQVNFIFPSSPYDLHLLPAWETDFISSGATLMMPSQPLASQLTNKTHLHKWWNSHNFKCQQALVPQNAPFDFPILGKPNNGFGGKGQVKIDAKTEIANGDYLWVPFLEEFEEYSIDFGISTDYVPSELIIRSREVTSGGFTIVSQSFSGHPFKGEAERMARLLSDEGAKGLFNLQVLVLPDGSYFFSDLNVRIGTSGLFGLASEVNLPLYTIGLAPKKKVDASTFRMIRTLHTQFIRKPPLTHIKGICIDYDNTLLDQKSFMLDKLEQLQAASPLLPDRTQFLAVTLELLEEGRKHDLFDQLAKRLGMAETEKKELIEHYRTITPRKSWLYRDVIPALTRLSDLGLKLAILSDDKSVKLQQKIALAPGLDDFWEFVYSCKDMAEAKPHPSGFTGAAQQMGIPIDQVMMVGDHLYRDIKGAIDAGYGNACWVNRADGFYGMRKDIFSRIFPEIWKQTTEVKTLTELVSLLEDAHEFNHSL